MRSDPILCGSDSVRIGWLASLTKLFRRWLWGIHLLQRLRVPPGFPRFPPHASRGDACVARAVRFLRMQ